MCTAAFLHGTRRRAACATHLVKPHAGEANKSHMGCVWAAVLAPICHCLLLISQCHNSESENYLVWKRPLRSLSVASPCCQGHQTTSFSATSTSLPAGLGTPALSMKKFFPTSDLNLTWHNSGLFPPVRSLLTREKEVAAGGDEVFPQPPHLQTEQPRFP